MAQPFDQALAAAARRLQDRETSGLDNALVAALVSLQTATGPLLYGNYITAYEANPAEFFVAIDSAASSAYGQFHTTLAHAAALVATRSEPQIRKVASLAALENAAERTPGHPVATALRARRREVGLLRWLAQVRNKAVQHRVEEGHLRSSAILDNDGIVLVRTSRSPDARVLRKARQLLTGFNRRYGNTLSTDGNHEPIARLDIASHFLFEWGELGDYASARRVVEEARLFHLTVSPPLFRNADKALAALIEVVPTDPTAPLAHWPDPS